MFQVGGSKWPSCENKKDGEILVERMNWKAAFIAVHNFTYSV